MSEPKSNFTVLDHYPASIYFMASEKKQKVYFSQTPYKIVPEMSVARYVTQLSQVTIFNKPSAC
jgi:predicted transcriptional regulator of viral defense system